MRFVFAVIPSPCTEPTAARLGGLIHTKNLSASGASAEGSKRKNLLPPVVGRNQDFLCTIYRRGFYAALPLLFRCDSGLQKVSMRAKIA